MNNMRVLSLVATLVAAANTTRVIHSNVLPQVNTTGDIMDAHDGTYNQWTTGKASCRVECTNVCATARRNGDTSAHIHD